MEMKFYICSKCGKIVAIVKDTGVPVFCCGQPMEEIIPGTSDASTEKHVPVYKVEGNKIHVRVGSADHPMVPEHYIEWVSFRQSLATRERLSNRVTNRKSASPSAKRRRGSSGICLLQPPQPLESVNHKNSPSIKDGDFVLSCKLIRNY